MPSRRDEFLRVMQRLDAERGPAAATVRELRSRLPLLDLPPELPEAWRTIGVVEELCRAAHELLPTSPRSSLTAAKLATSIAAALDDGYPRVLRNQATAHAWCTLSDAWREAGDATASLQAIQRARAALEYEPALVEERATADLTEGLTLLSLGAFDDARKRLLAAEWTFSVLGRSDVVTRVKESLAALETVATSSSERPDVKK